jgi:hypothetical protein
MTKTQSRKLWTGVAAMIAMLASAEQGQSSVLPEGVTKFDFSYGRSRSDSRGFAPSAFQLTDQLGKRVNSSTAKYSARGMAGEICLGGMEAGLAYWPPP